MNKLYELTHRANINVKHTTNSDVVIYEDHRTILNVLFHLKKNNRTMFPLNVILFDDHDDACAPDQNALAQIRKFLKNEPGLREFWSFTEFDLRHMDDDWIKAGMELGLINNLFLFNSTDSNIEFEHSYKTMEFGTKKIYNIGNVWDALSHRGNMYDIVKDKDFGRLWEDFGWIYDKESGRFFFKPPLSYILDFDLDCFSTRVLDKRIAIPEDVLLEKFKKRNHPTYHFYYTYEEFVRELIKKSEITTLCFENEFCGGFKQSFKIFELIDYLFFDSQIGA